MAARSVLLIWEFLVFAALVRSCTAAVFSLRLMHRFSDELKALRGSGWGRGDVWPEKGSFDYYRKLLGSDLGRWNMKLGSQHSQLLFPIEGSKTMSLGNDFGWLHYTWVDIGIPAVSFLVALDSGSDLLWVPCDCIKCAPLSAGYYSTLDKDLNEYSLAGSKTSKPVPCNHQLCELGANCKSSTQPCPYDVKYYSDDVSSSGYLVEDTLHFASNGDNASNTSVQIPVIIGCGRKQSGDYLDGVAPDGLMGLGLGKVSVPSVLANAGYVRSSFSLCFNDDSSGRIFFGDEGLVNQHSTPFLPLDGNYTTYIVGVDSCCIRSSCYNHTSFKALVDSGTSFTYFPGGVYEKVAKEFDRQVTAIRASSEGIPWEYCYNSSSNDFAKIPAVKFMFAGSSFVIHNPVFMIYQEQGVIGFCLAIQLADGDIGIIGQNFMTGYRMVFDKEKLKLGWSRSNCSDLAGSMRKPQRPSPTVANPVPQGSSSGQSVGPALAGKAPIKSSAASPRSPLWMFGLLVRSLLLFCLLRLGF